MKYVFLRSLQVFSLLIILSGLAVGIKDKNVMLELNALVIGSLIFYAAHVFLGKIK